MHQTDLFSHDWLAAHLITISAYCDKHRLTQVQDALEAAVIAALNRQAELSSTHQNKKQILHSIECHR